jgi:non-specific serine/threonine protein kinase
MEEDHDNVRVALDWSTSHNVESGLRLALAWVPFWIARGVVREGYERLATWHRKGVADDALRARTIVALGRLALMQGEETTAFPLLEEAVPLLRRYGPAEDMIRALLNLSLAGHTPNFQYLHEALSAAKESGKPELIAAALNGVGQATAMQGELKAARRLFQESLKISRDAQSISSMQVALTGLGTIDAREGDLRSASGRLRESLSLARRRDDKFSLGANLLCLASLAVLEGRPDRALRLAGAVESFRESLGVNRIRALFSYEREIDTNLQAAKVLLALAAPATFDQGRQMTIEQAIEYALSEQLEAPELASLSR